MIDTNNIFRKNIEEIKKEYQFSSHNIYQFPNGYLMKLILIKSNYVFKLFNKSN